MICFGNPAFRLDGKAMRFGAPANSLGGTGVNAGTGGGVPDYQTFNGILHRLLLGADSAPLMGADGYYLYGVA